jgi:hypothetical protein
MRTAMISDYEIGFPSLSPIFRLMEKYKIRFEENPFIYQLNDVLRRQTE